MDNNHSVLIVDDDPSVRDLLVSILKDAGYDVTDTGNPEDALSLIPQKSFHLVLSDILMPQMNGIELLKKIKQVEPDIPVMLITAYPDFEISVEALKHGAYDFILKPFKVEYVLHSVENALAYYEGIIYRKEYNERLEATVRERTQELQSALELVKNASREVIERLTVAAEYKDEDTASHINRISIYSGLVGEELGMSGAFVDAIKYASPMHDVGKIGIPDNILMKPGKLTREEFEVAKMHSTIGYQILRGSSLPWIQMGESIALTHHERWDGTGYPKGLKGEDIPLEGRIVMLVDQYDALRSVRPYKKGLNHEETCTILTQGDARTMPEHFDPDVMHIFQKRHEEFDAIFNGNLD